MPSFAPPVSTGAAVIGTAVAGAAVAGAAAAGKGVVGAAVVGAAVAGAAAVGTGVGGTVATVGAATCSTTKMQSIQRWNEIEVSTYAASYELLSELSEAVSQLHAHC
jgi:hypothetical protein